MELAPRPPFTKGFPILQECFGCGKLYALNHHCEAEQEHCNICQQVGHFTGFCEKWKHLQQAQVADPIYQPSTDTERVPKRARIAPAAIMETNLANSETNITRSNESGKRKRNQSSNDDVDEDRKVFCDVLPSNGMPNDGVIESDPELEKLKSKLEHYKKAVDSVQEKNTSLQKSNDVLKQMNDKLQKEVESERKISDKYQSKLRMYRNASLGKTLDNLKDSNERLRQKAKRCEEERNKLYKYVKKVEKSVKASNYRVSCLIKEHFIIVDRLYEDYPVSTLPLWYKSCKQCGSKNLHHVDDCIANGNRCGYCDHVNHFTASCQRKTNDETRPNSEEKRVLKHLEKESFTVDSFTNVMAWFETGAE